MNIIEAMMDGTRVETPRQRGERFGQARRARRFDEMYGEPPEWVPGRWVVDGDNPPRWVPRAPPEPDQLPF